MGCSPCNNCDDRRCQSYHSSDETTFVPDDISLTRLKLDDDDALPIAPAATVPPPQSDGRPEAKLKTGPLSPSQSSSREPHSQHMPAAQPIQPDNGPDTLDPDSFRPGVPVSQEPQPQTPKIHSDNAPGPTPPPKVELLRSGQGHGPSWEPHSHVPNIQPESPRAGQWQSWESHPYIPHAQHDHGPGTMVKPDTLLPGQWSSWEPHPHMPRVTWVWRELPDGSLDYLLHYADLGETRRFRDGEMANLERVDWPRVEYKSTRRLHPAPSRAHSIASPVARSDSSGETEIGEASEWGHGHRQGHNQEYYQGHPLGHRQGYDQEYHHHHPGYHHRGIPNAEYLGLGISSDRVVLEQEIRRRIRLEKEIGREEKKREREEKKLRRSGKTKMCFVKKKGRPIVVQSLRR